jgi:hypothetical protein
MTTQLMEDLSVCHSVRSEESWLNFRVTDIDVSGEAAS